MNYVQIYENRSSAEFLDSIKNTPLGYSFEDHLVNVIRYGFELNNQSIGQSKDFVFLRFNVESAGNLVNAANKVFNAESVKDSISCSMCPIFNTCGATLICGITI